MAKNDQSKIVEELTSKDGPVVLLLRHARQQPIVEKNEIDGTHLDAEETEVARMFGEMPQGRINAIYTSTFPFCRETAASINRGAQTGFTVEEIDWVDVNPFVEDMGRAMDTRNTYGHERVVNALYTD